MTRISEYVNFSRRIFSRVCTIEKTRAKESSIYERRIKSLKFIVLS